MTEKLVGRDNAKSILSNMIVLDTNNSTATIGQLILKSYTTTERDALPATPGSIIMNTTTNTIQFANNSGTWANI